MAERIAAKFPPTASSEKLEVLLDQMFQEYGYHGSTLDFHHRSNSYLNEVIDDREGLPITLSLLLMEVGQASRSTHFRTGHTWAFSCSLSGTGQKHR